MKQVKHTTKLNKNNHTAYCYFRRINSDGCSFSINKIFKIIKNMSTINKKLPVGTAAIIVSVFESITLLTLLKAVASSNLYNPISIVMIYLKTCQYKNL